MESFILQSPKENFYDQIKYSILTSEFSENISFTHIETVLFNSQPLIIQKYSIEGRVSYHKRFELTKLKQVIEDLCEAEGIRIENIWNVEIGYTKGDKLPAIHFTNINGNEGTISINKKFNIIHIWSIHNKVFNAELKFIELKNMLQEQGISNITQYMISGDNDFLGFSNFVKHKNWDIFLDQLISNNIFELLCLKKTPCLIITDSNSVIKYIGDPFNLNILDTIKEQIIDNDAIVYSIKSNKDHNLWWNDLDDDSKKEIIEEINLSLKELGIESVTFLVVTQIVNSNNDKSVYVIPVFSGLIHSENEVYLKNFIKDMAETLNFENIQEDIKYINEITKEANVEYLNSFEKITLKEDKGI